ncbi:hypothetical protein [Streptomyces qinglanensis]|uniref:hypothetical protein n=1 Tax=Streptomyces qinglanensis TaxID=943816 RepID=UPI0037BCB697
MLALSGVLVLSLAAVTVVWWNWLGDEHELSAPERVCRDTFSTASILPLFRGAEGDLRSEVMDGWPGGLNSPNLAPVCEVYTDRLTVGFRISYPGYPEKLREVRKERKHITELGSAYGSYSETDGTIILDVPCPAPGEPDATLALNVGASPVRQGEKGSLPKLADLTGYAARTLAQKVYKCKGAEKLPEGPVHIKKGEGTR